MDLWHAAENEAGFGCSSPDGWDLHQMTNCTGGRGSRVFRSRRPPSDSCPIRFHNRSKPAARTPEGAGAFVSFHGDVIFSGENFFGFLGGGGALSFFGKSIFSEQSSIRASAVSVVSGRGTEARICSSVSTRSRVPTIFPEPTRDLFIEFRLSNAAIDFPYASAISRNIGSFINVSDCSA